MFLAAQILRTDPAAAHGLSPASLLLGRQVVYPCEITREDIDFSGI